MPAAADPIKNLRPFKNLMELLIRVSHQKDLAYHSRYQCGVKLLTIGFQDDRSREFVDCATQATALVIGVKFVNAIQLA
jgi:hypothetical protein